MSLVVDAARHLVSVAFLPDVGPQIQAASQLDFSAHVAGLCLMAANQLPVVWVAGAGDVAGWPCQQRCVLAAVCHLAVFVLLSSPKSVSLAFGFSLPALLLEALTKEVGAASLQLAS